MVNLCGNIEAMQEKTKTYNSAILQGLQSLVTGNEDNWTRILTPATEDQAG